MSYVAQRTVGAAESRTNPVRDFAQQSGICVVNTNEFAHRNRHAAHDNPEFWESELVQLLGYYDTPHGYGQAMVIASSRRAL